MKLLLCLFFSLVGSISHAQRVIDVGKSDGYTIAGVFYTVGGEPVSLAKYIRVVEGSPFFNENWLRGALTLGDGRKYDSVQLRLDLVANELHYLDAGGNALIATTPVLEVWLLDSVTNSSYHFLNASAITASPSFQAGWYQLLADGPVQLLKEHRKEVIEVSGYGTAVKDQTITTKSKYYILSGGKISAVKKITEIPGLLKDKKDALEKFIKTNNLESKSDNGYISLISYYNTLQAK